jgi:hypothetical protein
MLATFAYDPGVRATIQARALRGWSSPVAAAAVEFGGGGKVPSRRKVFGTDPETSTSI